MINRYNEFLLENQIYDLLLESKVVFSSKFINLINKFNSNKISSELIKINSKDYPVQYNFIDITDEKDAVSFTPDRKAQELYAGKPETWMVVESGKYLTHSDKNNKIFEALGYNKEGRPNWAPDIGIFGTILSETISSVSGKTFVLFQEYDVENPRLTVLNKSCLEVNDPEIKAVWSTSRNNMKIGRLVRALLRSANVAFTDKDIEDFTNQYKATYDFAKDALKQFDIVKGDKIAYWYDNNDEDRYVDGGGSLNNSCMAEVSSDYFDIYTQNPQVSLVILYGDSGSIESEKYTDDRIKGRAILWDCKLDGQPIKFMDRIYTTLDADVELFKQFAEKNGWWYKKRQSMEPDENFTDGNSVRKGTIEVKLDDADFGEYPYCDTICYINSDTGTACNVYWDDSDRLLRDTGGSYEDSYDMAN
jgi:hypothetical protein